MSTRYLSIAHLETVAWIARLGSFTAAAARLHTTQPAVSARVRDLEANLGIRIFERKVRGVELTFEGREFVRNVEPLLLQLDRLSVTAKGTDAMRGTIRIGAGNICMDWFPTLALRLREAMPRVTYDVEVGLGNRLVKQLEAHKLDIAIVSSPIDETRLRSASLGADRMVWVAAPALLARHRPFDLEAFLQAVPIWCVQRESFYWHEAVSALIEHGLDPGAVNAIDNMAAAAQLVIHGAGIGLLSATLAKQDLAAERLVTVPGLRPGKVVEFRVVTHKDDERPIIATIVETAVAVSTFERSVDDGAAGP